jgi:hypothetical protein
MTCGPRCFYSTSPSSTCRCSCRGARHGQGNDEQPAPAPDAGAAAGADAGEAGEARVNVGVTPYRGAPRESRDEIDAYYESARFKGFERRLEEEAAARGVEVESVTRVDGLWEGDAEPATSVWLRGDHDAARDVGVELARRYNQDAVFVFSEDAEADGVLYQLRGVRDIAHARALLGRYGVTAARLVGRDLEIASEDDSLDEAVSGIAHELGVKPEVTFGRVAIIGREDYG